MSKYKLLYSIESDISMSRRFDVFDSEAELAKTLMGHFEDYLYQTRMDDDQELEYQSKELFRYLDEQMGELVCLSLEDPESDLWKPMAKDWVKERIYMYLKSISNVANENPVITI